eukprot:1105782-Amphidinium_carterae.3
MAPKKKRTVEEEALRLAERSVALERQAKRGKISKGLDLRPDLLDSVWTHLSQLMSRDSLRSGSGADAYSTPPCARSSASPGSEGAAGAAPVGAGGTDGAVPMGGGSASLAEVLTCNSSQTLAESERMVGITAVNQLTIPLLERFLAAVEPIALSSNAQRSLRAPRSRYISKEKLLQLYEFLTGLSAHDPVPDYLHSVQKWVNAGVEYNESCGRPARDLRMPPDWQHDGHYCIAEGKLSGRTKILHRGLNQTRGIDGFLGSVTGALHIEQNYSQKHATLVDSDGLHRLPLMSLFPDVARRDMNAWLQQSSLVPRSVSTLSLAYVDSPPLALEEPQQQPVGGDGAAGAEKVAAGTKSEKGEESEIEEGAPP